nr:hypothetical protein [uncultured Blautia sp.]
MKLTNEVIKNIQSALTAAGNKEMDDFGLAFKVAKNNYELMRAIEPIAKVENDILRKYGEKNEEGTLVTQGNGKVKIVDTDRYNQDITTLMKAESDVELEYFSEKEIAKMHMTPNQITLLMPVIK